MKAFQILSLFLAGGAMAIVTATAGTTDQWLDVPPQSLEIVPGSPLDFSALVPAGIAGDRGALRVAGTGFAFGDGIPGVRFNCGQLSSTVNYTMDFPDHAGADLIARQMRLHGYSLARFQNIDMRLRDRAGDAIDPARLDRFWYLLAALKREGIYWMLDVITTPGVQIGQGRIKPASADDVRIRLHFDPAARRAWVGFVDDAFAQTNPYTGISPLADPALAFVIGANENNMLFLPAQAAPYPTGFGALFDAWVRRRLPSADALVTALPDLTPQESAGQPLAPPADPAAPSPRGVLLRRFVSELENNTNSWMREQLAERGFHGPLLPAQGWYKALDNRTRAGEPVIDAHAYIGEVTSFSPDTAIVLPSATTDKGLGLVMLNAGVRWLDRPMVMSEYDQPFPNPYRYESGLLFPALAAFQGYGTICRNAFEAVDPAMPAPGGRNRALLPYGIGVDPIERANETLVALLFARGDVAPATTTVAVPFGEAQFARPGSAYLPAGINRSALLARFGLVSSNAARTLPPGTRFVPLAPQDTSLLGAFVSHLTGSDRAQQAALVAALRSDGALAPSNRSDPAAGIYQSETGELTVDQMAGTISVVTPRTEAVSATDALPTPFRLGRLTVSSTDGRGLVAVSSLDGMPLGRSRRMLLILASDARNVGMTMGGTGVNRIVGSWGGFPIQLRRMVAHLELATDAHVGRLSALSLRGDVLSSTPLALAGGRLPIVLDTGMVKGAPTTFFLIEDK